MQVTPAQWGNSLAVRIPKDIAQSIGLEPGKPVEMTVEDGRVVIAQPKRRRKYTIEELLEGVKPGDFQEAFDWGPDVGREIVDD